MDNFGGVTTPIDNPDENNGNGGTTYDATLPIYSVSVGAQIDESGYDIYSSFDTVALTDVSGVVNTAVPGTYTQSCYIEDDLGNNETVEIKVLVLSAYYDDAVGLYGDELTSALRTIISTNYQGVSYGDDRYYLEDVDADLSNSSNIWTIYDGYSINATWDSGSTWNREHVWCNSRMGLSGSVDNGDIGIDSDLHNLRASDPRTNSTRSNRFYTSGSGSWSGDTSDGGFFPGDEHAGDVARICFYMAVRYDNLILTDDVSKLNDDTLNYTSEGVYMGLLSNLLVWNYQDEVDDFETSRNNLIYGIQNNRNPFIDYPDFVSMIYYA